MRMRELGSGEGEGEVLRKAEMMKGPETFISDSLLLSAARLMPCRAARESMIR
jgi:hypothetical protein